MPKIDQKVVDELLKDYIRIYDKEHKRVRWLHFSTGEEFDQTQLQLITGKRSIAKREANKYYFDFDFAKQVLELVRKGRTLEEIGDTDGFPPVEVLLYWRSIHPVWKGLLKEAERDRANHYHDQIVRIADEVNAIAPDKDTLAAKKLAVDSYKWAAEKGDPDKYGKKTETKHSGEVGATTIIVNTGISRDVRDVPDDVELPIEDFEVINDDTDEESVDI